MEARPEQFKVQVYMPAALKEHTFKPAVLVFPNDSKDISLSFGSHIVNFPSEMLALLPWKDSDCVLKFCTAGDKRPVVKIGFENHEQLVRACNILRQRYFDASQFLAVAEESISAEQKEFEKSDECKESGKALETVRTHFAEAVESVVKFVRASPKTANKNRTEQPAFFVQNLLQENQPQGSSESRAKKAAVVSPLSKTSDIELIDWTNLPGFVSPAKVAEKPKDNGKALAGDLGLENIGNSCYMNAMLQALLANEFFTKDLYILCKRIEELKLHLNEHMPLGSAIAHLVTRRFRCTTVLRKKLLEVIKETAQFEDCTQQDAHEFLLSVLDKVQQECDTVLRDQFGIEDETQRNIQNPVTANFAFIIESNIFCQDCNKTTTNTEESVVLPVVLEQARAQNLPTIQTLVDAHFTPELLEKACDACGGKNARRVQKFTRIPRCLIVIIKRYVFNAARVVKLSDQVYPSYQLTLCNHCESNFAKFPDVAPEIREINLDTVKMLRIRFFGYGKQQQTTDEMTQSIEETPNDGVIAQITNEENPTSAGSTDEGVKSLQHTDSQTGSDRDAGYMLTDVQRDYQTSVDALLAAQVSFSETVASKVYYTGDLAETSRLVFVGNLPNKPGSQKAGLFPEVGTTLEDQQIQLACERSLKDISGIEYSFQDTSPDIQKTQESGSQACEQTSKDMSGSEYSVKDTSPDIERTEGSNSEDNVLSLSPRSLRFVQQFLEPDRQPPKKSEEPSKESEAVETTNHQNEAEKETGPGNGPETVIQGESDGIEEKSNTGGRGAMYEKMEIECVTTQRISPAVMQQVTENVSMVTKHTVENTVMHSEQQSDRTQTEIVTENVDELTEATDNDSTKSTSNADTVESDVTSEGTDLSVGEENAIDWAVFRGTNVSELPTFEVCSDNKVEKIETTEEAEARYLRGGARPKTYIKKTPSSVRNRPLWAPYTHPVDRSNRPNLFETLKAAREDRTPATPKVHSNDSVPFSNVRVLKIENGSETHSGGSMPELDVENHPMQRMPRLQSETHPYTSDQTSEVEVDEMDVVKVDEQMAIVNFHAGISSPNAPTEPLIKSESSNSSGNNASAEESEEFIDYNPISRSKRDEICSIFDIIEYMDWMKETSVSVMSLYDMPEAVVNMTGKSNCLYRALTYYLTGSEADFTIVRDSIIQFELDNMGLIIEKKNWIDSEWDEHIEKLCIDNEWADNLEIESFASICRIGIWIFWVDEWRLFKPKFCVAEELTAKNECIYLSYVGGKFCPVETPSKTASPPAYQLMSVVRHVGQTPDSGHYTCDIWHQNEWKRCSDTATDTVDRLTVFTEGESGYVFMYLNIDIMNQKAEGGAKEPNPPEMETATRAEEANPPGVEGEAKEANPPQ